MKNGKTKAALGRHGIAKRSRSRGLTIVEMAVAVAVCGVLAALLVPVLLSSRGRARRMVCAGNLGGLGQAYAICLTENSNYLPGALYDISSTPEGYEVSFKSIEPDTGNTLFQRGQTDFMICPNDSRVDHVALEEPPAKQFLVEVSYAYNLRLPVGFRNAGRVPQPTNTVTFYDGDPGLLVGPWDPEGRLAEESVRSRHSGEANFLFLDGHVEASRGFPASAFEGGVPWSVALGNNYGEGDTDDWVAGSGTDGDDGDDGKDDKKDKDKDKGEYIDSIVGGLININPCNNDKFSFELVLPDGFKINRQDLLADDPLDHDGCHPEYVEYSGPAVSLLLKPKGNGNQNSMTLNEQAYELENKNRYVITSPDMDVHLFNSKRNTKGKAMGKWWIEVIAREADIQIFK